MSGVETYLDEHFSEALEDLKAFCRIPSVSTDPAYAEGIAKAAAFVADRLTRAGFANVEQLATGGHPAVFGALLAHPAERPRAVFVQFSAPPVQIARMHLKGSCHLSYALPTLQPAYRCLLELL